MYKSLLITALMICSFITNYANAVPHINIIQTESGINKKDIRVIITEDSKSQLDYQSLSMLINGQKIPKNKIDELLFTAIDKSILDFTFPRVQTKQPLELEISISNTSGDSSIMKEAIRKNDDVTVDSNPEKQAKTMALTSSSYSSIWTKALNMAKRGTPNALIKAYLESKGYYCPPGPFFFCAIVGSE